MKQFWNQLPIWGKVIVIIIVLFVAYQIYRLIQRKINAQNYNAAVNQSQTALNQLSQQGVNPSYAQAQYTSMANTLQQAFDGCGSGWSVVKGIIEQLQNDADVYALIQAYGVRPIDKCGYFTGDFEGDLSATIGFKFTGIQLCGPLSGECGSIEKINDILKTKSIVFRF